MQSEQLLPQDVTALAWSGGKVIARLAGGRVVALPVKDEGLLPRSLAARRP